MPTHLNKAIALMKHVTAASPAEDDVMYTAPGVAEALIAIAESLQKLAKTADRIDMNTERISNRLRSLEAIAREALMKDGP